ncbi:MAG: hypothetical protein HY652_12015, partial [Acidobacteria bacterium]|nr:hypothetical protein [Acidobacteriota bacterium]
MFETYYSLEQYERKRPLGKALIASLLLHAAAVPLLILYPEIFHSAHLPFPYSLTGEGPPVLIPLFETHKVLTYVDLPKTLVLPTRKPEGDLYSDQDRTAASRPPAPREGGNEQPYSRGSSAQGPVGTQEPTMAESDKSPPSGQPIDELAAAASSTFTVPPGPPKPV